MKLNRKEKQVLDIILNATDRQQALQELKKISKLTISLGAMESIICQIKSSRPDLLPIHRQRKAPNGLTQEQTELWGVTNFLTY